jgi:hydroxyacylglutathione hydrolase
MTLEDHVGDVVHKARQTAGVSLENAAAAARITPVSLKRLEATGDLPESVDWSQLARAISLSGAKLQRLAEGWLPRPVDCSRWRELRQISTTADGNAVNAFLVWDEINREAALFDTGWDAHPILNLLSENRLALRHLFITHTHEDHVAALAALRLHLPAFRVHANSDQFRPEDRNRPQDCISLGNLRITHRDTPGHAADGVVYVVGNFPDEAPLVALVGDCLFAGSMGRGFQSASLLRKSVAEQILTLPPDTLLGPGHGPMTTVEEQKEVNPFF